MAVPTDVRRETKFHEKRRGKRMNSRVAVTVEVQPPSGPLFREDAITRVLGPYGCLLVLSRSLDPNQRLSLTNRNSQQTCSAVVVWNGKQRAEGWEVGIELLDPATDFWGLEL